MAIMARNCFPKSHLITCYRYLLQSLFSFFISVYLWFQRIYPTDAS
jgi:hypothetical protein